MNALNLKNIYATNWNQQSEFIVTVGSDAHDHFIWPSLSLKMAIKQIAKGSATERPSHCLSHLECFENLPYWILNEVKAPNIHCQLTPAAVSRHCLIVQTKEVYSARFILPYLIFSIFHNWDLHLLTPGQQGERFLQELHSKHEPMRSRCNDNVNWMVLDSQLFSDSYILRPGK